MDNNSLPNDGPIHKPKLLDQVQAKIRYKHYSIRTEEAYPGWIKRYIQFSGKRHPASRLRRDAAGRRPPETGRHQARCPARRAGRPPYPGISANRASAAARPNSMVDLAPALRLAWPSRAIEMNVNRNSATRRFR